MAAILEYIWLDSKRNIRSKNRFHKFSNTDNTQLNKGDLIKQLPIWNYDGSSTGQCAVSDSEAVLKPVNCIPHPFNVNGLLVLCENFNITGQPLEGNSRASLRDIVKCHEDKEVKFGLEQEFVFFEKSTGKPIGWKDGLVQGDYYCGINQSSRVERQIMADLFAICIKAGIPISGTNQEVAPGQWEYQIGPCDGLDTGDNMIFSKYILLMKCEEHGLYPVFHPKPYHDLGAFNGSGCHINISTKKTRDDDGIVIIGRIVDNMKPKHSVFIEEYCGENNDMRLTGDCETSDPKEFSHSIGGRNTSVRIPFKTSMDKKGYFEDRRPGSDIDYYKTLGYYYDLLI